MRATRAVIWGAGSLLLLGALSPSAGCGPNGVRRVKATDGGTGGEEETGGAGGGTGGSTGGTSGKGGTGGAITPDAAPDVGRDVAVDLPVVPDAAPDLAPDANAMEAPPPDLMGAPCATSMNSAWVNTPFPAKMGMFTAIYEVTPSSPMGDTLTGLSNGPAMAFTGVAVIVRFGMNGNIDARNGGAYAAAATVPYAANMTYRVRLAVDVGAHRYSIYVTPPGGQEQTLGMNYAFRTEQNMVTSLSSWVVESETTSTKMCGFAVQ
jgi:hypothetical protein